MLHSTYLCMLYGGLVGRHHAYVPHQQHHHSDGCRQRHSKSKGLQQQQQQQARPSIQSCPLLLAIYVFLATASNLIDLCCLICSFLHTPMHQQRRLAAGADNGYLSAVKLFTADPLDTSSSISPYCTLSQQACNASTRACSCTALHMPQSSDTLMLRNIY
jgi:hypothetical protein